MFELAELNTADPVSKICHLNLTGLLTPDLLYIFVSNIYWIFKYVVFSVFFYYKAATTSL